MWPYWILFAFPALMSVTKLQPVLIPATSWPNLWRLVFVVLVLLIGLRHDVGGDWESYLGHIEFAKGTSLQEIWARGNDDIAYGALNWVAANMELGGLYFSDTISAAFFSWGLIVFCRAQPRPWLALTVAIPYLVIVVAMGYTRQGVAIGLVMLGLVSLSERKIFRFLIFVTLAGTFHKTAIVLMPLAVLAGSRNRMLSVFLVLIFTSVFYVLLLQDAVSGFQKNYIQAQYESSGAAIRVAMNAVPALLFLMFRRRFEMSNEDRAFWTWMSLGALAFIGILIASPSSTAVDRMALYWIPLQLFVLSRLPNALGRPDGLNAKWVYAVVGYSAAVQFVWLFFAQTAFAWLPYQFYPWVALWS